MARLRKKVLRRYARGPEVKALQQRLHDLHYDVGPIDGIYGYITENTVRHFQKEHRLRIDGKAGKQVRSMLYQKHLHTMRQVHIVKPNETLQDIAKHYGVSADFIRHTNRLRQRPLYAGQRLVLRHRYVIGAGMRSMAHTETSLLLRRIQRHVSAVCGHVYRLCADGSLHGEWSSQAAQTCREHHVVSSVLIVLDDAKDDPRQSLHQVIKRRAGQRKAIHEIKQFARKNGVVDIVLDCPTPLFGDGRRFTRFVSVLAYELQRRGKKLFITAPVIRQGIRGWLYEADVHWRLLNQRVNGMIIPTHRPDFWRGSSPPSPEQHADLVRSYLKRFPSWTLLLGISFGAHMKNDKKRTLTYQRALASVYMHQARPAYDEQSGLHKAVYSTQDDKDNVVWLPNRRSVVRQLQWVERYHLQGVFLWPIDEGDKNLWAPFPRYISAFKHEMNGKDI